jgi:hypothetical protein
MPQGLNPSGSVESFGVLAKGSRSRRIVGNDGSGREPLCPDHTRVVARAASDYRPGTAGRRGVGIASIPPSPAAWAEVCGKRCGRLAVHLRDALGRLRGSALMELGAIQSREPPMQHGGRRCGRPARQGKERRILMA